MTCPRVIITTLKTTAARETRRGEFLDVERRNAGREANADANQETASDLERRKWLQCA